MAADPEHLILDPLRVPAFVDRLRATDADLDRAGTPDTDPTRQLLARALETAACQPAYVHAADAPLVAATLRRQGRKATVPLLSARIKRMRGD